MLLFGSAHTPVRIKDVRAQFYLIPGITIKGLAAEPKESKEIIESGKKQEIEYTAIQLEYLSSMLEDKDLVAAIKNNLGCAYVCLGRYDQGEQTLQETQKAASQGRLGDTIREAARYNLALVQSITKGY